jgi:hypothetical protein
LAIVNNNTLSFIAMKKISKKDIAHTIEEAMGSALEKLKISKPSKKTIKLLGKVSKKFSGRLKVEVRKLGKKSTKATKTVKNGTSSKKTKTQETKAEQA